MRNLSTLQVHLSLEKSWIVTNCWYPHSELCSKIFWEGSCYILCTREMYDKTLVLCNYQL